MKSAADGIPHHGEAGHVVPRSRARYGWIILAIVVVGAAVASPFALRAYRHFTRTPTPPPVHFVSAGVTSAGTVMQVVVQPGQMVRKGELLAVLDYSHQQAVLDAAENNLILALEQAQQSSTPVALPTPPIAGRFEKKAVPIAKLPPMPAPKPIKVSTLPNPSVGATQLSASAVTAQKKVDALQDQIKQSEADIPALQQKIADEQEAVQSAQALVTATQNVVQHTQAERQKASSLLAQGVISANEAAKAETYAAQAQGQWETAKVRAAAAIALLGDTQRQLDAVNAKLSKARSDLPKAQQQLALAKKQPSETVVASSGTVAAQPPPPQYKLELKGPVAPAPPPAPVQVNFTAPQQALQQILKAEQALEVAQHQFDACCVYAPASGKIISIRVRPGQTVQPGVALVVIQRER